MNFLIKKTLIIISMLLIANNASAIIDTNFQPGKIYVGPTVGLGVSGFDDSITFVGIHAGMELSSDISAELEYMTASDEETNHSVKFKSSHHLFNAYGVYRHYLIDQPMFVKAKAGLTYATYDFTSNYIVNNSPKTRYISDDGFSIGYGMGMGYDVMPNVTVEAELSASGTYGHHLGLGAHVIF